MNLPKAKIRILKLRGWGNWVGAGESYGRDDIEARWWWVVRCGEGAFQRLSPVYNKDLFLHGVLMDAFDILSRAKSSSRDERIYWTRTYYQFGGFTNEERERGISEGVAAMDCDAGHGGFAVIPC